MEIVDKQRKKYRCISAYITFLGRIEVFLKIQKKIICGEGGVRVIVNKELKFLRKFTKKIKKLRGGVFGLWGGGGGGGGGGVRVDVTQN